jgi:hypothetical protein
MDDINVAAKWVLRNPAPSFEDGKGVHPQERAEQLCEDWRRIWQPQTLEDVGQVASLQGWLHLLPQVGDAPPARVGAEALKRTMRRGARKAAGPDGWSPGKLSLLPIQFYEQLEMLWQSVLDGGELPLAWAAVRVAMIPKAEGAGQRPLSIAACVWRAGGSVLLAQMKDWIRAWAPPELAGGLPERDLVDVIERIREDLQQSDFLLGTKVDIAKCFDSTSFDQAIAIFKALGAQAPVCEVLRRFYLLHVRFVEIDGACAAHPIEPSRALLQGCPFSPVLLAAVMCLWWKVV